MLGNTAHHPKVLPRDEYLKIVSRRWSSGRLPHRHRHVLDFFECFSETISNVHGCLFAPVFGFEEIDDDRRVVTTRISPSA